MMYKITYLLNTLQQHPLMNILWKFTLKSIGFQYIFDIFQYISILFLKALLCINEYGANNSHISFKISTIIALKKIALNKTENLSLHSVAIITIKYTHTVGPTSQNSFSEITQEWQKTNTSQHLWWRLYGNSNLPVR